MVFYYCENLCWFFFYMTLFLHLDIFHCILIYYQILFWDYFWLFPRFHCIILMIYHFLLKTIYISFHQSLFFMELLREFFGRFFGRIKRFNILASSWSIKHLKPFLAKEILLDTIILLISIFFYWNRSFMLVKVLLLDFNITNFFRFLSIFIYPFKSFYAFLIYNFSLFL